MSLAVLKITDGITTVDLLSEGFVNGFELADWEPTIQDWKDGGIYQDSSLADGRQLTEAKLNNVLETMTLNLAAGSQDVAARAWQDLRRLLYQAVRYWIDDYRTAPVWLEARSGCETNSRYAVIYNWRTPADANPYAPGFTNGQPLTYERQLILERGPWLESAPGTGVCAAASDEHTGNNGAQFAASSSAAYNSGAGSFSLTARYLGEKYHFLALFDCSVIPQGATIVSARLMLRAYSTLATDTVNHDIVGDDEDTAVAFTDAVDYLARPTTAASVAWNAVEHFTAGGWYNSPDIAAVVQEIVSRPGWTGPVGLFVIDNGSDAGTSRRIGTAPLGGGGTYLYVVYATTTGRAATCLAEVYVANKHNYAELTHAYRYDDSSGIYSANLIGAALPAALLDPVPAVGDFLYIGTDTALVDSGPFNSVIFDLTAGADYTADWEYWDGGAWAVFTPYDTTATLQNNGVGHLQFEPPGDWAETAVCGVTGYWLRLEVTAIGGAPTAPYQQNRTLYTATIPYTELAAAQLPGDLPALLRSLLYNVSDTGWGMGRVFCGARSVPRAPDFTAYLNCSDEQNPAWVTVNVNGPTVVFADDILTPTGRAALATPGGPAVETWQVAFEIDPGYAPQYYGKFRLFVRTTEGTTVGDYALRVAIALGGSVLSYHGPVTPAISNYQQLSDFGLVTIPDLRGDATGVSPLIIQILATATAGTGTLEYIDLILLPVDEFFVESNVIPSTSPADNTMYLDIDSVSGPRHVLTSTCRLIASDYIYQNCLTLSTGPWQTFPHEQTRLWWLVQNYYDSGSGWDAHPTTLSRLRLERQARYYSLRGDR